MVPLGNIMTGEVIFGGVGAGLYGMLMYAIIAVFIAGLMVGRTPEYLGKKIEQYEVKMAMLAVLVLAADILCFTALGANLNLAPGKDSQTFTAEQKADEDKLLTASPPITMSTTPTRTASRRSSISTLPRQATTARRLPDLRATRLTIT
jgi:hypothetical protein